MPTVGAGGCASIHEEPPDEEQIKDRVPLDLNPTAMTPVASFVGLLVEQSAPGGSCRSCPKGPIQVGGGGGDDLIQTPSLFSLWMK